MKNFQKYIIKKKKEKFKEVVYRTCETRELPIPRINFDGCEAETEEQLAHYHPNLNMICVSERQLNLLNFDDIEEVASHEVTHILIHEHNSDFVNEHQNIKTSSWKPPRGIVHINSNKITTQYTKKENIKKIENEIKKDKNKKPKRKKGECSYHLCRKKTTVYLCPHCEEYFCKEHKTPIIALMPPFKTQTIEDRILLNEWHNNKNHPCVPYYDKHIEKLQKERYRFIEKKVKKQKNNLKKEESYLYPNESFLKNIINRLKWFFHKT